MASMKLRNVVVVAGACTLMGVMGDMPIFIRNNKENLYQRDEGLGNQFLASPGNLSSTLDIGADPDYDRDTGAYRGIGYKGKGLRRDGTALE